MICEDILVLKDKLLKRVFVAFCVFFPFDLRMRTGLSLSFLVDALFEDFVVSNMRERTIVNPKRIALPMSCVVMWPVADE